MRNIEHLRPPLAEKQAKPTFWHGEELEDPWHWLRQAEDPTVLSHLAAENTYTDAVLATGGALREQLFAELKGRLAEDDTSVPLKDGPYEYYSQLEKGKQYPKYYRRLLEGGGVRRADKKSPDGPVGLRMHGAPAGLEMTGAPAAELLLDLNALAGDKGFCELGLVLNSPDHDYLIYSLDEEGDESYTVYVKDLASGELIDTPIPNVAETVEWANDSRGFYYTILDEKLRPYAVFFHRLGTPHEGDRKVYEEADPRFFVGLDKSENDRFVFVVSEGANQSEWWYVNAASSEVAAGLTCILARRAEHEYEVSVHGESFYLRTNWEAEDFRLVRTPIAACAPEHWQDLIPAVHGQLLEGFLVFESYLVVQVRRHATPQLEIHHLADGRVDCLCFDEEAYEVTALTGREFASEELRWTFTSLKTPTAIYSYNMRTGERTLLKQQAIPDGSFAESNYRTRRLLAPLEGGQAIPISLLYRHDTPLDGSAPLYLYAYGAYGLSLDPHFSIANLSLVDRGFIYAIAHVRGGMEHGRQWYLGGKLFQKKNTFTDFIAAAEFLVERGYTSSGQIVAAGGSAGGLIMGVVANERPELFRAIVAQVAFVDILNTMLDESLPLTAAEYSEWGDPREKAFFDYIRSYSPYDNVRQQVYPAVLVTAGFSDPRVTYWEAAKWVQRLRDAQRGSMPILLRMHMDSGHLGASGRYDQLREIAEELAFVTMVCER